MGKLLESVQSELNLVKHDNQVKTASIAELTDLLDTHVQRSSSLETRIIDMQQQLRSMLDTKAKAVSTSNDSLHRVKILTIERDEAITARNHAEKEMAIANSNTKLLESSLRRKAEELSNLSLLSERWEDEVYEAKRSYEASVKFGQMLEREKFILAQERDGYKNRIEEVEMKEAMGRTENALRLSKVEQELINIVKENEQLRRMLEASKGGGEGKERTMTWEIPD
jgi:hypothetical protein